MASDSASAASRPDLEASAAALEASAALSMERSAFLASASQSIGGGPSPNWLGKKVGRFRLIGMIGRGAMGKVFRAEDVQLHRLVALKVISSRSSRRRTGAQKLELLVREAQSAAKLEHPNIVSVYEVSSVSDIHFIAMELVEGGNLKDLVTATGPLDVARACQLCSDAAEGLQHAHEQGVIHRDVKPANLMLTRTGRCKLADFGLARIDDPSDTFEGLGKAVGTPQYVAPEVIQEYEATALSDIYSLGATLFYLLTGVPPFPGENSREVLRKHIEELPPDVRTLRPDVPESLALAVWRAMAKQPTARFESAGHFSRALRLHTISVESDADRDKAPTKASSAFQRFSLDRRRLALGAVLGGGFVIVIAGAIIGLSSRTDGKSLGIAGPLMPATQTTPAAPLAPAAGLPLVAAKVLPGDVAEPLPIEPVLPKAADVVQAVDTATLLRVARETDPQRHDGTVTVEGRVVRVELDRRDDVYRIDLRGVDRRRGLACTFDPATIPELMSYLDGDPGTMLSGKRIRVSGTIDLSDGRPLLEIREPQQIHLME